MINESFYRATSMEYIAYDLYWNSLFTDSTQDMYQLGQVKFTCRVDSYQEDATAAVTITEDDAIADPVEQRVDLRAGLTLQINKAEFDGGSAVDESSLTEVVIDSGASTYGQASITYTAATDAKLGDYMELKLVENGASGVMTDFS